MKTFQKFTVKDIIFLAILSAALTIASGLTMPLVMTVTLFGVRNLVAAAIYGIFSIIALLKVRKPGALVIVGFFHGAVLLMMAPVMFFNMVIGAIMAELIVLLFFKNYDNDISIILIAGLYIPFTLPTTLIFTMVLNGQSFRQIVGNPLLSGIVCVGTVVLSFVGVKIGLKIGKELQRAGKL
jgi:energy-coupling factor transport system substrate-specific component